MISGAILFRAGLAGLLAAASVFAADSTFREALVPHVAKAVPSILKSQDPKTGRFIKGLWIVTDQDVIWTLAAAWGTEGSPYDHSPVVLDAIMKGGDALIDAMDWWGEWKFQKKDGSTWGKIYMPWTYSRWIRTFGVIKDAMPPDRRNRWEKAITLGVEEMIKTQLDQPVQNIPATDAAAIYRAGQIFGRKDWQAAGRNYLHQVAAAQDPAGFWSEHVGPVVSYNFIYMDALGLYYAYSHDKYVLPALERAAKYHAHFTYPDGRDVETVDERHAYDSELQSGNVGFTFSASGRGFLQQQEELSGRPASADRAATIVMYGEDGPIEPTALSLAHDRFVLGTDDAMTAREGPWFACLSAYTAPLSDSRWIQDRQNFVSLYHDKVGLVLGGGNTKLQPLWSTFTAGDTSLLFHKPGDENPNFAEPTGLIHLPSKAKLDPEKLALDLTYGKAQCRVSLELPNPHRAVLTYALKSDSDWPIEAHATFLPNEDMDTVWKTASGKSGTLKNPLKLSSEEAGGSFAYNGWRVELPPGSNIVWPAMAHYPYNKDGSSTLAQARIVVVMPLGKEPKSEQIIIEAP